MWQNRLQKMKSYSEVDDTLAISLHQNQRSKQRLSRIVLSAGTFLFAVVCGLAILTALGRGLSYIFIEKPCFPSSIEITIS